jgi:hypothetical protein
MSGEDGWAAQSEKSGQDGWAAQSERLGQDLWAARQSVIYASVHHDEVSTGRSPHLHQMGSLKPREGTNILD